MLFNSTKYYSWNERQEEVIQKRLAPGVFRLFPALVFCAALLFAGCNMAAPLSEQPTLVVAAPKEQPIAVVVTPTVTSPPEANRAILVIGGTGPEAIPLEMHTSIREMDREYRPDKQAWSRIQQTLTSTGFLEYALVHSGSGNDWWLFQAQPVTDIFTPTYAQTQLLVRQKGDHSLVTAGTVFPIVRTYQISPTDETGSPPLVDDAFKLINQRIKEEIGAVPSSVRFLAKRPAFLILSNGEGVDPVRKLALFVNVKLDGGDGSAPGGDEDPDNACSTLKCYWWCFACVWEQITSW